MFTFIKKWGISVLLSSCSLFKEGCDLYWITSEWEVGWLSEITDWAVGWMTKESWFNFCQDKEISVLPRASRPALRPTQPPV